MKALSFCVRLSVAVVLAASAGCGARSEEPGDVPDTGAPASAVVMTGPLTGFAVWPSGSAWVVLATGDGWHTVQNRTPLGVPTDGGLVLAAPSSDVLVGVLPHELLTSSPVLRSATAGRTWAPAQLPGALLGSPASLTSSDHAAWAVLAGGAMVAMRDGTARWVPVTTNQALDPTGQFRATGIEFPDGRTGFVTGDGPADRPVIFYSEGLEHPWQGIGTDLAAGSGPATSLTPCRVGASWLLPVVSGGQLQVFTAHDVTGPWIAGPPLPVPSVPVVACGPDRLWVAVTRGATDGLFRLAPGGSWSREVPLPAHVISLTVASAGQAFAATDEPDSILSVTVHGPVTTTWLRLPDWVATLGGEPMRD